MMKKFRKLGIVLFMAFFALSLAPTTNVMAQGYDYDLGDGMQTGTRLNFGEIVYNSVAGDLVVSNVGEGNEINDKIAPKGWYTIPTDTTISYYELVIYSNTSFTLRGVKEAQEHTITLQTEGSGTVTSDVTTAKAGDTVTLSRTTGKGYKFASWDNITGGFSIETTATGGSFTMPDYDVTIKAIFKEGLKHKVELLTDGNGTVTTNTPEAIVDSKVSLVVTPNEGYEFKEWQVLVGGFTIDESGSFTMPDKDVKVKAIFVESKKSKHSITVKDDTASILVTGTDSSSVNPNTAEALESDTITLTHNVTPTGYVFKGWKVISGGITIDKQGSFIMPNEDVVIEPILEKVETKEDPKKDETTKEDPKKDDTKQEESKKADTPVVKKTGATQTPSQAIALFALLGSAVVVMKKEKRMTK